jgi:hypothetical protein
MYKQLRYIYESCWRNALQGSVILEECEIWQRSFRHNCPKTHLEGYCIESSSVTITLALESNLMVISYNFCKGCFALNKMEEHLPEPLNDWKGTSYTQYGGATPAFDWKGYEKPWRETVRIVEMPTESKSHFKNILKINILVKFQDASCYTFPTMPRILTLSPQL